jgi:hypothetical protein
MRDPLLDNSFSLAYLSEKLNSQNIARRQFLKTVVVASAVIGFYPTNVLAEPSDADTWRNRIADFAYSVCDDRTAGKIADAVSRATVAYAPTPASFHMGFAAPLVLVGTTVGPQNAGCSNCFELDSFPYYDINNPCLRIKDMNAFEMRRVANSKEVNQFGCILAPCNERQPVYEGEMDHFRRTAESYGYDPDTLHPNYKRPFNNHHGRVFRGYGVTTKRSIGSAKPERDMLLSTEDV